MSANRKRPHDPLLWVGFQTVGLMRQESVRVDAHCERCRRWWELDLAKIEAERGPHYTLIGRRIRCGKRHEAALLAKAPGRPSIPIHRSVAEEWTDTKRLQGVCGWCGKDHRGTVRFT